MSMVEHRQPWILDEETRFPLSIYPTMDAPDVYTRHGTLYHKDPDEHHIFHTKRGLSESNIGPGGPVMRFSRIQKVRRYHHDAAHRLMAPPPIVFHEKEQFDTSLWSLVNLIPRQAVDVRGDEPVVRNLDNDEYNLLRELTRADYSKGFHSSIGRFLIQHMVHEYKEAIDDDLRCQLLEAKYIRQRREIGNRIIKIVTTEAVNSIMPLYTELKKNGEIPPEQKSPYKTVLAYSRSASSPEKIITKELAA